MTYSKENYKIKEKKAYSANFKTYYPKSSNHDDFKSLGTYVNTPFSKKQVKKEIKFHSEKLRKGKELFRSGISPRTITFSNFNTIVIKRKNIRAKVKRVLRISLPCGLEEWSEDFYRKILKLKGKSLAVFTYMLNFVSHRHSVTISQGRIAMAVGCTRKRVNQILGNLHRIGLIDKISRGFSRCDLKKKSFKSHTCIYGLGTFLRLVIKATIEKLSLKLNPLRILMRRFKSLKGYIWKKFTLYIKLKLKEGIILIRGTQKGEEFNRNSVKSFLKSKRLIKKELVQEFDDAYHGKGIDLRRCDKKYYPWLSETQQRIAHSFYNGAIQQGKIDHDRRVRLRQELSNSYEDEIERKLSETLGPRPQTHDILALYRQISERGKLKKELTKNAARDIELKVIELLGKEPTMDECFSRYEQIIIERSADNQQTSLSQTSLSQTSLPQTDYLYWILLQKEPASDSIDLLEGKMPAIMSV